MSPPQRFVRGFTLIEILIALSISAIIATLLYATFRATTNASEIVEGRAELFRKGRVAFTQLIRDFSMAYQKEKPSGQPLSQGGQTDEEASVFGSFELRGEDGSQLLGNNVYPNDAVQWIALAYPPVRSGMPMPHLAKISYFLSEKALMRDARFLDTKTMRHEVIDGVLGLNFRYFNPEEEEWLDAWDPDEQEEKIPTAVEIELVLAAFPETKEPSERPFSFTFFATPLSAEEQHLKTMVTLPFSQGEQESS